MMRRATFAWLLPGAALFAVAFVLRLGAGSVLPLGSRELFRDEAASWLLAQYPVPDLLQHAAGEAYPPLYATLLKGWIAVLGDSEWALRSLSAVAGLAVVLAAWRWAHESLGRYGGMIAAILVALSPLAIANSRDTRMYGLETAFATAAWFLIWRMLVATGWSRRRRTAHAILLAIAVAGEVWSLALGLVLAGMQISLCVGALVAMRTRMGRRKGIGYAGAAWASAGCAAGLISFLPWAPKLLAVAGNGQSFWTGKPDLATLGNSARSLLVGSPHLPVDSRLDTIGFVLTVAALLLAVIGLVSLLAKPKRPGDRTLGVVLLAASAFVPLVWIESQVRPVYDTRYMLPGLVPGLILVAVGLCRSADWLASTAGRNAARLLPQRTRRIPSETAGIALKLVLLAGLAVPMIAADVSWLSGWTTNLGVAPTRAIVDKLATEVQPGDVIIAVDARSYFTTAYYGHRLAESGSPLPCAILGWDSGKEPFFYGQSLIDPALTVRAADADARGLRAVLPGLGPTGRVWVVAIANGTNKKVGFAPLETGVVRETDRQIVRQPSGDPGQIILAEFPGG